MKPFVRFIRICSIVALGLGAAPFVACAEPVESESMQSESEISSDAVMRGGAEQIMDEVFEELKLRPEQQSEVDKLKSEFKSRYLPVKAAKRELMAALADQIEEGDIDRCALDPEIKNIASALAKAHPGDRKALERLHAILDKDQRATFVDGLKRRWRAVEKGHDPRAIAEAAAKALKLTPDQKARMEKIFSGLREIKEAEPDHSAHHERWGKILEAFKGERFVLDEIVPAKDMEAKSTEKIEHLLWAAEAVLPVLNAEQRALVAKALREKARDHGDEHGSTGKAPTTD